MPSEKPTKTTTIFCTASLLAVLTTTASAQIDTFTSGLPPIGDGNIYPASLNPARQNPGGGISPQFFDSLNTDVTYQSLNGNPAYFDANNLLTRPASLITGEAFWTDPKLGNFQGDFGPFSVASVGFFFNGIDSFTNSFGFDLAVASVSNEVPDFLNFQIQDDQGFIATGSLLFEDFSNDSVDEVVPTTAGTFFSLNSPRVGREARYRIDFAQLRDLIDQENSGSEGFEFAGSIGSFDIDLRSIATNGGTTQLAIDNFVIGGATVPTSSAPTYLPPTPPVGANTPQYFDYADIAPPASDGDTYDVDVEGLLDGGFVGVTVVAEGPPSTGQGAGAYTSGATIYFNPATLDPNSEGNAVVGHEVTHTVQVESTPGGAGGNEIPANAAPVGTLGQFSNFITNINNQLESNAVAPANQIIDIQSVLPTIESDAEFAALIQQIAAGQVGEQQTGVLGSFSNLFQNLVTQLDEGNSPAPLLDSQDAAPLLLRSSAIQDEPLFYQGYTVTQYLSLKELLGEAIALGEQGSYITPIFDEDGEILTYRLNTWTVTDQSGLFLPILTNIPEPTSLALLLPVAFAMGSRRRLR